MVGDSTWDCEAAKRAGLETVGVLTGGFSEQELLEAGAACVFRSIAELRERLGDTPLAREARREAVVKGPLARKRHSALRPQRPVHRRGLGGAWGTTSPMPRSIWSGAISFGLVNVPVKLYSAVSRKSVRFHQLHDDTQVRIQQRRVDPPPARRSPTTTSSRATRSAPSATSS